MATVTFCKEAISLQLKEGTELQRLPILNPDLPLRFGCRKGACGACLIRVKSGIENLSAKTKEEKETLARLKVSEEYRLACQCAIREGELVITSPSR